MKQQPLKQAISFLSIEDMNRWLSAKENEKYATDIRIIPHGTYPFKCAVIYWEESL